MQEILKKKLLEHYTQKPNYYKHMFVFVYGRVDLIVDNNFTTAACIYYDDERKTPVVCFNDTLFEKEKNRENLLFLVLVHEMQHLWFGHSFLPFEEVKSKYPDITPSLFRYAKEYQVNVHMKVQYENDKYLCDEETFEIFYEFGTTPKEEWIPKYKPNRGLNYWIKKVLKHKDELAPLKDDDLKIILLPKEMKTLITDSDTPEIDPDKEEPDEVILVSTDKNVRYDIFNGEDKVDMDIKQLMSKVLTPSGYIKKTYGRMHPLVQGGILPKRVMLKTPSKGTRVDMMLIVDVSCSMSNEQLNKARDYIKQYSRFQGKMYYALIDDELRKHGLIKQELFEDFVGGGTTQFAAPYEELRKLYRFDMLMIYTDGGLWDEPDFRLPKDKIIWLLCDEKFNFKQKGIHVWL